MRGGILWSVISRDIRAYLARDWAAARDAKDAYWAERIERLGPPRACASARSCAAWRSS